MVVDLEEVIQLYLEVLLIFPMVYKGLLVVLLLLIMETVLVEVVELVQLELLQQVQEVLTEVMDYQTL